MKNIIRIKIYTFLFLVFQFIFPIKSFDVKLITCYSVPIKIDMTRLWIPLDKATAALAELNYLIKNSSQATFFIQTCIRKEALLSSQIEGIQSSFMDLILFENNQNYKASLHDIKEVSNYVNAIYKSIKKLDDGNDLSLELLKEAHKLLFVDERGIIFCAGEFRKIQNWIGGTSQSNAIFVPPSSEDLNKYLTDFEIFLHDTSIPKLIKIGLAHEQFETIHPFLDGNGRLGRLLISMMLHESKLLDLPVLYLSLYFKQHRRMYYDLLQEVRLYGNWQAWLEFFLEGIYSTSKQVIAMVHEIDNLFATDYAKIETLGRARFSCIKIMDYLKNIPQVSVPLISKELNMSAPAARRSLEHLVMLEIIKETSGKQRDKVYEYEAYLAILEKGAEPFKKQSRSSSYLSQEEIDFIINQSLFLCESGKK